MLSCISRKKKLEITANVYKNGALEYNKSYTNKLNKKRLSQFNDDMDVLNTILNSNLIKEQNAKEKLESNNLEEAYKDIIEKTQIKETKKTEPVKAKDTVKDVHQKGMIATKSSKKEKHPGKYSVEDESENDENDNMQYENKLLAKEKQKVASLTSAMHRKQAKAKRNNLKKKFFKNKLEKSQPSVIEAK
jgi:hypothetical protein